MTTDTRASAHTADVIIAGAGPTGLMLAAELRLAGIRPLVLELRPQLREVPRANGFGGQILRLLRYRGLLDRFEAVVPGPPPVPRYPFGGVHVDLSGLADPPLRGLRIRQPKVERLLADLAGELGAEVRRGHEIVEVNQAPDSGLVTAGVNGPDGSYRVAARYLVGCDGSRSLVRALAGIAFPGTTYPEVNRLGQVRVPDSVIRLANGDLEVPGLGRIRAGFTRTDRGLFAFGGTEILMVQTTEDETTAVGDDVPMTLAELQASIRRVLGGDLPMRDPVRLSRYTYQARQAERYRAGRILLAGDAAHQYPATGVGISSGMLDAVNLAWKLAADIQGWAPQGLLDTYDTERRFAGTRMMLQTQAQVALRRGHDPAADALREVVEELLADEPAARRVGAMIAGADVRYPLPGADRHPLVGTFAPDLPLHTEEGTTSVAELMHAARPVLLDLADRAELREVAREWQHRVDVRSAKADQRPADALLIRPDAHIAWAAPVDEPAGTAVPTLREALARWFGAPSRP